jgi:aryl-alcohol dehydrogenase-like predicted oxidoreductase
MNYRNLGRTGVKVSVLGLGTENFGPRTSEADACEIVDRALAEGVNLIDTANFYGTEDPVDYSERRGQSERIVGTALKRNGKRNEVILATKVRGPMWPGPNGESASRYHILRAVEESLRRLQTDRIDLYQIHWPDEAVEIDETLRALDDLVHAGKILYIGTSNFYAWQIIEGFSASERFGLNRSVSEQALYNLAFRQSERELFPMALKHKLGILVWSPLFAGFLTGKYRKNKPMPSGTRLADDASERNWPRKALGERADLFLDRLEDHLAGRNCTMAQFAMAWVLNQPAVTSALMGPRTMEQLNEYLGALQIEITEEDVRQMNVLVGRGGTVLDRM